ncbi:hypothetical protein NQ317_018003 [Molorchus minor]|uniref:Uncharacterized protein n=1 Tax=Molorchus minor TaxID=1323400 RepID=A0ABQ9IZV2_9CUCU|nr:hypothetical protein NQ317_018003 [Molorchus minor]
MFTTIQPELEIYGRWPGALILSSCRFSLQFDIGEVGSKRVWLEKTCKSGIKNWGFSCGCGSARLQTILLLEHIC